MSPQAEAEIVVPMSALVAPSFYGAHTAIRKRTHTSFWLKGGRGSTKSSFVAIQILRGIIADPDANAIAFRKVGETLRDSVLSTFVWAIEKMQMTHLFRVMTSPAKIIYIPTGQEIILKGLDKAIKLKSIRPKKGYFKFLWFEEGSEFDGPDEMRSVQQSVLRGGPVFFDFVTYNPPNDPNSWINEEYRKRQKLKDHFCHHSTYLDIPRDWLGPRFLQIAEELERDNFILFQHEYLGEEIGRTDSIIFGANTVVRDFDIEEAWAGPYYGADFGFADDPNTLLKMYLDDTPGRRKRLYIREEAYGNRVLLDDMPALYGTVTGSKKHKIYGDNSRPETIAHLKGKGFDIEGAEKGDGSVEEGIVYLQACEIIIHPSCVHTKQEARLYCFKVDRLTLDVTKTIVDKHNHCWDAIRYALWRLIKKKPKGFFD